MRRADAGGGPPRGGRRRRRRGALRGARARLGRRAARRRRPQRPRRDAPLDRPRHGRGRPRPVPGDAARDRPGDRRRLLLRLQARPAADARRPRRDRGADGRVASPPTTRSSAASSRRTRGGPSSPSAASRSRSRSSTTSPPRRTADGAPMPPTSPLRARPVRRPVQRPARREHGQDRAVQAARRLRGVLARRREAAGAPADLRHGLADPGGARRATSGDATRRRSATTAGSASSSTCSASTTSSPGSAFWHPKGQLIWRTLEGAMRELQIAPRLRGGLDPDRRVARSSGGSPATGTSTARTCSSSSPRGRRSASSR